MEQMSSYPLSDNKPTGKKLPGKKVKRCPVNRSGAVNKACFTTVGVCSAIQVVTSDDNRDLA